MTQYPEWVKNQVRERLAAEKRRINHRGFLVLSV